MKIDKARLESTRIGKKNQPNREPLILAEDMEQSYPVDQRVTDNNHRFDERLVFGDNLLALKALEESSTGKIECIYQIPAPSRASA